MADDLPDAERRKVYIERVKLERDNLDSSYSVSLKLLDDEIQRMNNNAEPINKGTSSTFLKLFEPEPIKVTNRIYIPIKEFPKFNFVGKLLGTKGVTLKALQNATHSRICIFGQGSIRDKDKEEALIASGDSKYAHLTSPLHVFVEVMAHPLEASSIMAFALKELSLFLDPNLQAQTLKYPGTSIPKNDGTMHGGGGGGGMIAGVAGGGGGSGGGGGGGPLGGMNGGGGPGGNMNCGPGNQFMGGPSAPMDQQQGNRQMFNNMNNSSLGGGGGGPPGMNNMQQHQHGNNPNMNGPRGQPTNNMNGPPGVAGHVVGGGGVGGGGGGGGANNTTNNNFNHGPSPMDTNSRSQQFTNQPNQSHKGPHSFNKQKETYTYDSPGNSFNVNKSNYSTRGNFKKDWRGNQGNRAPFQPY